MPLTELTAVLIAGSLVPRNLCHNVSDPCGSASTNRHGLVVLWTCAARWAARVLFPEPPLRDAKTITFISFASIDPREGKMNQRADSWKRNLVANVAKTPNSYQWLLLSHTDESYPGMPHPDAT